MKIHQPRRGSSARLLPSASDGTLNDEGICCGDPPMIESHFLSPPTLMQSEIDGLLLSGRAETVAEAESLYLDAHLLEIIRLAESLPSDEFRHHELVRLLFAHGSRAWEGVSLA